MEDIKDFLVAIDTETLVKHESRWQQLKVRVCLPHIVFWYTLFVYHLIKHMRTALHDHMLARMLLLWLGLEVRVATDRTRTHSYSAAGDVGEENHIEIGLISVHVVCSWSWAEVVYDLV